MPWLSYSDGEVEHFHPQFLLAGAAALQSLGMTTEYRWEHHPKSVGVGVVPDFVLIHTQTNRWVLVVEIKRTKSAVFSERNQVQAKGYAEANRSLFATNRPHYFAITNLESTLLFALHGASPPRECRIQDMTFESGSFLPGTRQQHQSQFTQHLSALISYAVNQDSPTYEMVWPALIRDMLGRSDQLPQTMEFDLSPNAVPEVVSRYFAGDLAEAARREFLLRCLTADYLRGVLVKFSHARAGLVPAMRGEMNQLASMIDALREIDFAGLFEPGASQLYRSMSSSAVVRPAVEAYLDALVAARVSVLAATRGDTLELPEILNTEAFPHVVQNRRGKAQTDPDLAALLATLTIEGSDQKVLDPGCGDGNLVSAAYDILRVGKTHAVTLSNVRGLEADPLAAKIAALRLVLKEPHVVARTDANHIRAADMFSHSTDIADADVILMNPPFKRYEATGDAPIPAELKEHYRNAIVGLPGNNTGVETDSGQANIYNLYVEFIVKACKSSASVGVILDNKWFHNTAAEPLRALLLRQVEIVAIVSYPHDEYFVDWTIATSMLIFRRRTASSEHRVQFLRTSDARRTDFAAVARSLRVGTPLPQDWRANSALQADLDSGSWQKWFTKSLANEFREQTWPNLEGLFEFKRRGSLAKEGGGIAVYEFPIDRGRYGPKRSARAGAGPFQTQQGPALTAAEEDTLRQAASRIPADFRGYAVQNADQLAGYSFSVADVSIDETIESPHQRLPQMQASYFSDKRRQWDIELDAAVLEIAGQAEVGSYVASVETIIGLTEAVLPRAQLWNALREPYAGELVIPRKMRVGHRVHVNPFAYNATGRQVRLSSNFLSYGNCQATDQHSGRQDAVELIAAFLMSSFGQLQFEMEAYNREGARSIEQHQVREIRIFDPRWIRPDRRAAIIHAWRTLPYPVPTDQPPFAQPALVDLDRLFASEIAHRNAALDEVAMLDEVWQTLFELIEARRP